jgi:hypothetical protein
MCGTTKIDARNITPKRYGGHEYYSAIPETPSIKGAPMTSVAHEGNICYFDGWNAFTILFGDHTLIPSRLCLSDMSMRIYLR